MIDILVIINVALGILLSKLFMGVINEGYRFKWQRVRLEFKRIFSGSKRHKEKIEVSHKSKEYTQTDVSFLSDAGGSKTSGQYPKPQEGCAFSRFFNPPN